MFDLPAATETLDCDIAGIVSSAGTAESGYRDVEVKITNDGISELRGSTFTLKNKDDTRYGSDVVESSVACDGKIYGRFSVTARRSDVEDKGKGTEINLELALQP